MVGRDLLKMKAEKGELAEQGKVSYISLTGTQHTLKDDLVQMVWLLHVMVCSLINNYMISCCNTSLIVGAML